jgi:hypothetical protein
MFWYPFAVQAGACAYLQYGDPGNHMPFKE